MPRSFPDDPKPWKVRKREYLSREFWYTVRVDEVELPTGTVIPKYWISEYRPWVNVVAITPADEVVLIRQYRHGLEAVHFELPAGTTDPGETSLEGAARRELLEERATAAARGRRSSRSRRTRRCRTTSRTPSSPRASCPWRRSTRIRARTCACTSCPPPLSRR